MKTKYDNLKFEVEEPEEKPLTKREIGRNKKRAQKKAQQAKAIAKRRNARKVNGR